METRRDTHLAIAGRDREMGVLRQLLRRVRSTSAIAVVVGDPGIGKSTMWEETTAGAVAGGLTVLAARPAEAEVHFAWSGLTDLLAGVPAEILDSLPAPQRDALDAACLRVAPSEAGIDARAVYAALHAVVTTLAPSGPVLIAIDDMHWLDAASVQALAFVARRLPNTGACLLATVRSEETGGFVREVLDVAGATRIDLEPLGPAATAEVVQLRLGILLSGPALERVHTAAGGNTMFAIELARANEDRPGRPTGVPASLRDSLSRRLAGVSGDARLTLAALAATGRSTVSQLKVAGFDRGLAEAERADLARLDGGRAQLAHPLIGAAAYAECDGATRREVHTGLARAVTNAEERARHAALGTPSPGPDVLAALDDAAASASRRGAPAAAAELITLALDLTPEGDDPTGRHLAAGEAHFRSGDSTAARAHFEHVLAHSAHSTARVRAALRIAEVAWETDAAGLAVDYATRAVDLAADDPALQAESNVVLSRLLHVVDLEASAVAAARAVALLDAAGPDANAQVLAAALVSGAAADFEFGRGLDLDRFQRAITLERDAPPSRVADRADAALASLLKMADDLDGSRNGLLEMREAVIREGDDSSMPFVLGHLVQVELWAGRWSDAVAVALEHLAHARRTGQDAQRRQADYNLAIVAAHRGDETAASEVADNLAAEARESADSWAEMSAENVLGFVDFCRGDYDRAIAHFDVGYRLAEKMGLREPGRTRSRTDHIESLLAIGDRASAVRLLDEYEARARAVDRASALGAAERCRALLAAAQGDERGAMSASNRSLAEFDRVGPGSFAFERARSLLVAGRLHRRAKQKRAAHECLAEASEVFAALGAKRFVDQVQVELDRVGLGPRTPSELTVAERRVAELAASGLTTRQIADAAFISPKTVEANLTRVYRKLGLRSRAELGAWLARQSDT